MNNLNHLIELSYGEYDDYKCETYRVLKPFVPAIVASMFDVKRKEYAALKPTPEDFVTWLVAQGYVEKIKLDEIYLGERIMYVDECNCTREMIACNGEDAHKLYVPENA